MMRNPANEISWSIENAVRNAGRRSVHHVGAVYMWFGWEMLHWHLIRRLLQHYSVCLGAKKVTIGSNRFVWRVHYENTLKPSCRHSSTHSIATQCESPINQCYSNCLFSLSFFSIRHCFIALLFAHFGSVNFIKQVLQWGKMYLQEVWILGCWVSRN